MRMRQVDVNESGNKLPQSKKTSRRFTLLMTIFCFTQAKAYATYVK